MLRYVGLDVHKKSVQACILDHTGAVLVELRFDLGADSLLCFAHTHLGDDACVVLEATTNTWAVVAALRPHAREVVVSNPLQTRAIAQAKVKTDKIDARVLAQLLRADFIPRVWQPDAQTQQLRQLTSRRASLVASRTAVKNRLHATLAQRLLCPPGDLFARAGLAWLKALELDATGRAAVDSDLRLMASLEEEINALDQRLAATGYQDQRVKLLLSLPGVDVTCAQTLLAALGDISRFGDGAHAAAYLGLAPTTHQSGEHCHHGPISKAGNGQARWTLIQAAQHLRLHPGPMGVFFRKLARKKNYNVAVVATARKLVVVAWHMLSNNEPYRYAQPRPTQDKLSRLRIRAGGQRRQGGTARGTPRPPRSEQPSRRIKPLAEVYQAEGLPASGELPPGERRMIQDSGTAAFVESLGQEQRVPRRRRPSENGGDNNYKE